MKLPRTGDCIVKAIRTLSCLLLICVSIESYSQVTNNNVIKEASFLPPTPEVASLFKFSEVPVDLASGTPNISVDLYTIDAGSLKHNINLAYHASAIRVNEIASTSGLGWNLNVSPAIMRTIRGKQAGTLDYNDEQVNFLCANDITHGNIVANWLQFYDIHREYSDVIPDEYSLSIDGFSGKFFQDTNHVFVTNPLSNIKISRYGKGFKVISGSGIQYIFDLPQYTEDQDVGLQGKNITGLNLTKMVSADRKDTISFEYSSFALNETLFNFAYTRIAQPAENTTPQCPTPTEITSWAPRSTKTFLKFYNNVILRINFKGGHIQFDYANREDRRVVGDFLPRISEMKIFAEADKLLKSYRFTCDIFQSAGTPDIAPYILGAELPTIDFSKRLRLNQIDEVDAWNRSRTLFKFEYHTSKMLPARFSFSQDYWGFYNGKINTDHIRKRSVLSNQGVLQDIGGANKNPDSVFASSCILTRMFYPTGGYSVFQYEGNMAEGPAVSGGIRIKSVKYYRGDNQLQKTEDYTYGTGTQLTGLNVLQDDLMSYKLIQDCPFNGSPDPQILCDFLENPLETIRAQPISEIGFLSGNPVVYAKVTKSIVSPSSSVKLSSEFNFRIDHLAFQWPHSIVASGRKNMPINNSWKGAKLLRQIDYKDVGGGVFVPVKTVKNGYSVSSKLHTTVLIPLFEPMQFNIPCAMNVGDVGIINYPLTSYRIQLDSTVEVEYSQTGGDSLSAVTKFEYVINNNSYYLRNIIKNNSKGLKDTTEYKYVFDFLPDALMGKMVGRNMLNTVIQQQEHLGGESSMSKKVMKDWFNDSLVIEPQYLEQYRNGVKSKDIYQVNSMNAHSKILEWKDEKGITKSELWDQQHQYLLADVTGATQANIAFTSFEDGSKGNWVYSGVPIPDYTAPTGKMCYPLGNQISRTGLSASTTYLVTYWKKSGTVNVNGANGVAARIANGWTYYEHTVVNPASGTITVTGTNGIIDELRLYPASQVLMTTFTYEPLVGITSQCDHNNQITLYEYDEFQRLIFLRDRDRNIIKKIAYHYNGQPENLNIYYNDVQTGAFTKQGCSGCQIGSAVLYTVPAGVYMSTISQDNADDKAQADLVLNGPINANANGTCNTPVNTTLVATNTITNRGFTLTMHNECTGVDYNYTLSPAPNTTNLTLSPQLPQGTYTATFGRIGGSGTYTFHINGSLRTTADDPTVISNVIITPTGNQVRID